jgi:hypothetical protein
MLAMADQHGYVGASMPGLAGRARVSLDACIAAITLLESPDEWSRTKEHDGRRIAPADGGWVLLNHAKYRAIQDADDRRERSRVAMAELRARRREQQHGLTKVNGDRSLTKLPQAEAEAEAVLPLLSTVEESSSVEDHTIRTPNCPTEDLIAAYHEALPELPKVVVLTASRKKNASSRWKQVCVQDKLDRDAALEWFIWYFKRAGESDFLTGRKVSKDGRVWKADFEWLMNPSNFAKVLEGRYHK